MNTSARGVTLFVVAGFFVLPHVALAQVNPLRIIADTDTIVPGQVVPFQIFAQLQGVDPAISGRNIVFGACCPTGIYGWFDDELRVIVNTNSTFPGSGNPLGFDLASGSSPSISGRNVAFS